MLQSFPELDEGDLLKRLQTGDEEAFAGLYNKYAPELISFASSRLIGVEVYQFSNKVDFVQVVKLKNAVKTTVSGSVEFMTCNDEECMPPKKQPFSIALK